MNASGPASSQGDPDEQDDYNYNDDYNQILTRSIPRAPFPEYLDETVYNGVKDRLGRRDQPSRNSPSEPTYWMRNPRLYTLLRMLGHEDGDGIFKKFEKENIGDLWLPLPLTTLKQFARVPGFNVQEFNLTQYHILTDPKDLNESNFIAAIYQKRNKAATHRHLEYATTHFIDEADIGVGGSARVVRVCHILSEERFACKRLTRHRTVKRQQDQMEDFVRELDVLKRIKHHHIVKLIASITDMESFSFILPIADQTLSKLLESKQPLSNDTQNTLHFSFNCLATALEFLHSKKVRHKDIKPSNILLSNGRVLLCDFGISLAWTDGDNGTTDGVTPCTFRYAAPEVLRPDDERNKKTDIWALGIVYHEIINVLVGFPFNHIKNDHRDGLSSRDVAEWLRQIRDMPENPFYQPPVDWALAMILDSPAARPQATSVVQRIHEDTIRHGLDGHFVAPCCRRSDYVYSSTKSDRSFRTSSISSDPSICVPLSETIAHTGFGQSSGGGLSRQSHQEQSPIGERSLKARSIETESLYNLTATRLDRGSIDRGIEHRGLPQRTASTNTVPRMSNPSHSAFPRSMSLPIRNSSDRTSSARLPTLESISGAVQSCEKQENERLLSAWPFSTFMHEKSATMDRIAQCCDIHEKTIQVFETVGSGNARRGDNALPVYKITRRIVVKTLESPEERTCYSFWIPLADIQFTRHEDECAVTLKWSDCNQLRRERTEDQREFWSWTYDPSRMNNTIDITFCDPTAVQEFLDAVRFPHLPNSSRIVFSDAQGTRSWDIVQSQIPQTVITLTNHDEKYSTSTTYFVGKYIDPCIEKFAKDRHLIVRVGNVSKPEYISDHTYSQMRSRNTVAKCKTVKAIKASLTVSAALNFDSGLPIVPPTVVVFLNIITGWDLQYFESVENVKSEKNAVNFKSYGSSDVMVWVQEVQGALSAQITIRSSQGKDPWMSGAITSSTTVSTAASYKSKNSTCSFDMFGKQRGRHLDRFSLTAVSDQAKKNPASLDPAMGFQQESRRMTLYMRDHKQRQRFAELVEDLVHRISRNPRNLKGKQTLASLAKHVPILPTPLV